MHALIPPDGQVASGLQCCVVGLPICGSVLAPSPARLTHPPSLLQLRLGLMQQSRCHAELLIGVRPGPVRSPYRIKSDPSSLPSHPDIVAPRTVREASGEARRA